MDELFSSTPKSIPDDDLTNRHQMLSDKCMTAYIDKCKGSQQLKDKNKRELSLLLEHYYTRYQLTNAQRLREEDNKKKEEKINYLTKKLEETNRLLEMPTRPDGKRSTILGTLLSIGSAFILSRL